MKYYRIILNRKNSRNNTIIIKCYAETIVDTCIDKDCSLKLYLEKLKNGVECQYLLFDYLDKLFKYGISKFKNNAMIKYNYAMFLMTKMNNKKQAIIILNSIKEEYVSFYMNYNIYRCRNLINKWSSSDNCFYFNYRSNISEFKNLMYKTINLYYKFWDLLYESKYNQKNNFNNLYKYGTNIMKLNLKIEELYNILIKTKTNNIIIYKIYSEYIKTILNNKEKYQKYNNINYLIFNESVENDIKKYSNFNMDILKQNNNTTFLLISGREKDLGTIIDCSISASTLFGYTKDELIGEHINILIPELFHFQHNLILKNLSNKYNLELFERLFQKKEYSSSFIKGNYFGVIKSKFIKSLKLKVYYIKTEDNLIAFIVEITNDIPYLSELIKNKVISNNIDTRCCVLTNENFLIHEFTPNSIKQLGLSYRYIKSNNSIIPYIKQLNDDYKNIINDLTLKNIIQLNNKDEESSSSKNIIDLIENISPEIKSKIKNYLINKKYNKKCQITWRIIKNNDENMKSKKIDNNYDHNDFTNKCSRISYRGSSYNISSNKIDENQFEVEFIMEIKKAILDNKLLGYYFYFSKLYPTNTNNFINYYITEKNNYDKKGDLKKITKYKTIFKTPQSNNIKKKELHIQI